MHLQKPLDLCFNLGLVGFKVEVLTLLVQDEAVVESVMSLVEVEAEEVRALQQ